MALHSDAIAITPHPDSADNALTEASDRLLSGLPLRVLRDYVPAMSWVPDCLATAVDHAKGVALVGAEGVGKTLAVQVTVREFHEEQRRDRERGGAFRRVVIVPKLEAKTRKHIYATIYKAVADVEIVLRARGVTKSEDQLRTELIARISEEGVAALVFEDAQSFGPEVLEAIRDIMAIAQDFANDRLLSTSAGTKVQVRGVGVLLVGTHDLELNLKQMADRHWLTVQHVGAIEHECLPDVFQALLPAFGQAATQLGASTWSRLLKRQVARGRSVPIAQIEDIIRLYVRRTLAEQPDLEFLHQVPWDAELFEQVVEELRPLGLLAA